VSAPETIPQRKQLTGELIVRIQLLVVEKSLAPERAELNILAVQTELEDNRAPSAFTGEFVQRELRKVDIRRRCDVEILDSLEKRIQTL